MRLAQADQAEDLVAWQLQPAFLLALITAPSEILEVVRDRVKFADRDRIDIAVVAEMSGRLDINDVARGERHLEGHLLPAKIVAVLGLPMAPPLGEGFLAVEWPNEAKDAGRSVFAVAENQNVSFHLVFLLRSLRRQRRARLWAGLGVGPASSARICHNDVPGQRAVGTSAYPSPYRLAWLNVRIGRSSGNRCDDAM
jgi:hypothetical protein